MQDKDEDKDKDTIKFPTFFFCVSPLLHRSRLGGLAGTNWGPGLPGLRTACWGVHLGPLFCVGDLDRESLKKKWNSAIRDLHNKKGVASHPAHKTKEIHAKAPECKENIGKACRSTGHL